MKKNNLEKLKNVLSNYSSDELYQRLLAYPSVSGVTVSDYLLSTKIYCVQFEQSINYIDDSKQSSNDEYYEISNHFTTMGLAA